MELAKLMLWIAEIQMNEADVAHAEIQMKQVLLMLSQCCEAAELRGRGDAGPRECTLPLLLR